jgi:5-methylcytosine-specific restriction protein A
MKMPKEQRADASAAGRSLLCRAKGGGPVRYKESKPLYHTKAWRCARTAALKRDNGMCCDCMDKYKMGVGVHPNRATLVHHIQSIEDRPDLTLILSNLRSLCDACHNKRHPEKGSGRQEAPRTRMRVIKA